jgi:hypothetical protein
MRIEEWRCGARTLTLRNLQNNIGGLPDRSVVDGELRLGVQLDYGGNLVFSGNSHEILRTCIRCE